MKITKEEGKNVYKIEMPFEDSDEEEEKKWKIKIIKNQKENKKDKY